MKKSSSIHFMKYAGMAFQMGAIILISVLLGQYLDKILNLSFPMFTLIFVLFGTFASLYLTLKDFITPKKGK
jgi:F0F1-type ATP synthase assembly protein I